MSCCSLNSNFGCYVYLIFCLKLEPFSQFLEKANAWIDGEGIVDQTILNIPSVLGCHPAHLLIIAVNIVFNLDRVINTVLLTAY
jgi:hypothetical protein